MLLLCDCLESAARVCACDRRKVLDELTVDQ